MTSLHLRIVILLFCTLSSGAAWSSNNENRVTYDGTLVDLACVIDENAPTIINMGTIIDKEIYLHGKTVAKPFSLTLKDCNPAVANTVKITLNGTVGNVTLENYLRFDQGSEAQGAVVGITDDAVNREPIPMGTPLKAIPIKEGTMHIPLFVYVRGLPEAIANKTIVPGSFQATLFYTINFE